MPTTVVCIMRKKSKKEKHIFSSSSFKVLLVKVEWIFTTLRAEVSFSLISIAIFFKGPCVCFYSGDDPNVNARFIHARMQMPVRWTGFLKVRARFPNSMKRIKKENIATSPIYCVPFKKKKEERKKKQPGRGRPARAVQLTFGVCTHITPSSACADAHPDGMDYKRIQVYLSLLRTPYYKQSIFASLSLSRLTVCKWSVYILIKARRELMAFSPNNAHRHRRVITPIN